MSQSSRRRVRFICSTSLLRGKLTTGQIVCYLTRTTRVLSPLDICQYLPHTPVVSSAKQATATDDVFPHYGTGQTSLPKRGRCCAGGRVSELLLLRAGRSCSFCDEFPPSHRDRSAN